MTDDLKTCLKAGNYMRACALIKTEDVHELLEIDGQVKSPLWFAARFRLPETVALLLKLGADPNHVVEMLAKAGADFDAPNALLWTARDILNELEIPFAQ
jgi:ankyrin repeat protein